MPAAFICIINNQTWKTNKIQISQLNWNWYSMWRSFSLKYTGKRKEHLEKWTTALCFFFCFGCPVLEQSYWNKYHYFFMKHILLNIILAECSVICFSLTFFTNINYVSVSVKFTVIKTLLKHCLQYTRKKEKMTSWRNELLFPHVNQACISLPLHLSLIKIPFRWLQAQCHLYSPPALY